MGEGGIKSFVIRRACKIKVQSIGEFAGSRYTYTYSVVNFKHYYKFVQVVF
jgi:hypothetical protein